MTVIKASAIRARARRIASARRRRMQKNAKAAVNGLSRRVLILSLGIILGGGALWGCVYGASELYANSTLSDLCIRVGPAFGFKTDIVSVEKIDFRDGTGMCVYLNGVIEARTYEVDIDWMMPGRQSARSETGYRTRADQWQISFADRGADGKWVNKEDRGGKPFKPAPPLPDNATPEDRLKDAEQYTVGEREARVIAELAHSLRAPIPLVSSLPQWLFQGATDPNDPPAYL